jgi:tRNA U38,U39,U40 pseudouridine synthase TruA
MGEAGERLCGVHDFRNFCKMDVNNGVVNYQRRIFRLSVSVLPQDSAPSSLPGKQFFYRMYRTYLSTIRTL